MYSMKRTMWGVPLNRSAIGTRSCSFTPRLTTMLILIGLRPASPASSMARSTGSTGNPMSFIEENTASSTASRLTVSRPSPAARKERARCPVRSEPLVVRVRSSSPGTADSIRTRSSSPWRRSGSPPVSRIFRTPCPTKIDASRAISSNDSSSLRGMKR